MFDPRGTFVIHTSKKVFIWVGSRHPSPYLETANKFTRQLILYENAAESITVYQGLEPNDFLDLLSESSEGQSMLIQECEAYTADYERFARNDRSSLSLKETGRSTSKPFRRTYSQT